MKPAARFLLIGLASVVLLTFIAGVGVVWQTRKLTQSRMLEHLQAASAVESELQADRLRELQIHGDALASDPAFVDYIAQSLIPNPKLGGGVDSQSIDDLLSERRRGYDIAVVLDATGKPVGHSGTLLKDDASIRKEAFVANCIEMRKPTHGLWADHGQLILVAANPMLKGGVLQGVVLTATHLDADFATAIQRLTRTGIVLFVPAPTASGTSASNGLASWIAPALVAEAQQMIVATTTSGAALKLSDGQHDMAAWATPLDADGGHAVLVALDSGANGDATMHASTTQLLYGLLLSGIIGIVIVLLQWSRTYVPLQGMIDIIERAAQGDQHLTVPAAKGSPIVLYLRGVINRLLERQRK